jgi:methylmalonyl-CoA/ethylmalonyl-CoA epimerase
MKLGVTHVGISVGNMDEAIRWWGDLLGFQLVSRDTYDFMDNMEIAFLRLDEFEIELFCSPKARRLDADYDADNTVIGTKHVAFEVDDMDEMLARIEALNVHINFQTVMEGDRVCFVADPWGTPVELISSGAAKQ